MIKLGAASGGESVMWAVPWSISINLLYFDKEVISEHHGLPEPTA